MIKSSTIKFNGEQVELYFGIIQISQIEASIHDIENPYVEEMWHILQIGMMPEDKRSEKEMVAIVNNNPEVLTLAHQYFIHCRDIFINPDSPLVQQPERQEIHEVTGNGRSVPRGITNYKLKQPQEGSGVTFDEMTLTPNKDIEGIALNKSMEIMKKYNLVNRRSKSPR